ncbi:Oidioi.mRNA.OKI2018_I69.XSR.g14605.t1.cds [Oikopleura dioica]|uniref:ubiquitinyl hydrolase 1 n=1 Tax=Oikopleura dioica TaxID=34765 RepID=A0ABN7SFC0_OIKDI|nr:Oidioi.mRNA.OKI2018_I69.XSR.g14605.t1.cds [Oikopleura dioica]
MDLPLPRELRKLSVLFFFASPEKRPRRFEIQVSKKGGSVREIYLQVSKNTDVPLDALRVLTSYKKRLHKSHPPTGDLDDIDSTSEVIASQIKNDEENVVIGLSHRKELRKVSDPDKCQCCGVEHSEKSLKRCAKCKDAWYCSKECIKENFKYHKSSCEVSKEFIGNPLFISVPRRISRSTLHKLILDYAAYSIDYSWSVESLERQKNATSDYETPPSSPEQPELGDDFETENQESTTLNQPINKTRPESQPLVPFRLIATTQHGTDLAKQSMTEEEDVYLLDDVTNLTAEWLNDKHRVAKKDEPYVPWLESVSSVNHEDIRADRMSSYDDTVTLERCIELFSEAEILEEDDFWYCGSCKEHVAAQKQLSLWKLPKVLIFHLKRFHYRQSQSHYSIRRDKINKLVDYQVENLDMSPFVIDPKEACNGVPPNYELCGVVNHMGSMSFGHYTAYVKHPDKESQWRLADDSHVRDVRQSSVVSDNGYLLFYKLKEPTKSDSKPKLNIQSYEEVKLEEQMEKLTFESLKETYEAKEQEKLTEDEEEEEDSNEDERRH